MQVAYNYIIGDIKLSPPFLTYINTIDRELSIKSEWRSFVVPYIYKFGESVAGDHQDLFNIICMYIHCGMDEILSRTKTIMSNEHDINICRKWIKFAKSLPENNATTIINKNNIYNYIYKQPSYKHLMNINIPAFIETLNNYIIILEEEIKYHCLYITPEYYNIKTLLKKQTSPNDYMQYSFIEYLIQYGIDDNLFTLQKHLDHKGLIYIRDNIKYNIEYESQIKEEAKKLLGLICASDTDNMIMIKDIKIDKNNDFENISII